MTSHLAAAADGNPYVAPGFDYEAHDRWVRDGNCPVVSVSKAYCEKPSGHSGRHGSPMRQPTGSYDVVWTEWER